MFDLGVLGMLLVVLFEELIRKEPPRPWDIPDGIEQKKMLYMAPKIIQKAPRNGQLRRVQVGTAILVPTTYLTLCSHKKSEFHFSFRDIGQKNVAAAAERVCGRPSRCSQSNLI